MTSKEKGHGLLCSIQVGCIKLYEKDWRFPFNDGTSLLDNEFLGHQGLEEEKLLEGGTKALDNPKGRPVMSDKAKNIKKENVF